MGRLLSYLVVEGPHDIEFVGRFLKIGGLSRVKQLADLDAAFARLVPTDFPHQGDLLKRVPVPTFFQNERHSIAVHAASGIDNLKAIQVSLQDNQWVSNDSINAVSGLKRFGEFLSELFEIHPSVGAEKGEASTP